MHPTRSMRAIVRCLLVLTLLLPLIARTGEAPAAPAQGFGAIGRASGSAQILNRYDAYFVEASATYAFPANLIKAVAWVEEGWTGTSPSGAVGIMQIIPRHWGDNALRLGYDIFTSRGNILMGTYILNYNLRTYGTYEQAVRHYLGVGVDPVTGISNNLYWAMVKERWGILDAAPGAKPIVDPELRPNAEVRGRDPYRARDGNLNSSWYVNGAPKSAVLQIDLGATIRVSSIWWIFKIQGAADRFAVGVSLDGRTWKTVGRFSNAPAKRWQLVSADQRARYVRLAFANPNADPVIGYVAELEVYGQSVAAPSAATATPTKKATRTPTPKATSNARPAPTATPTVTVTPVPCTASPTAARFATSVAVSCAGFTAGERVGLFWDTTESPEVGSFTADGEGSGSGTLRIPEAPGGAHVVWAVGETSGTRVKIAVTVKPRASLDPSSGTSGGRVEVTLRGFQPKEHVTITWYVTSDATKTLARDLIVSSLGTVVYTLTVPSASLGAHKVDARGALGSRASANFTVTGTGEAAATAPSMSSKTATVTSPSPTKTPTATSTPKPTTTVAPTETLEATATPTQTPTEAPSPTPDPTPPDPSPTTTTAPVEE